MKTSPPTVSQMVARFQLRRRATTPVFAAGVRLARQGAVHLDIVTEGRVLGTVEDTPPARVELQASAHRLEGGCSCAEPNDPCRHQVAVAHALWVRDRRH